jgi:pilus assembly protein CpaB
VNKRLISVLIFALVVSAAASFVVYRVVVSQITFTKPPSSRALVATHNLESGTLIKDADVTVADWTGPVPPGVLTKPEDAVGRGVIEPIYNGELVVETRIAARGAGAGLASIIPSGMRAVAVRVNDIVGVAGFIAPGTHVDILIAGNPPGANTSQLGTITKTLLQNIEVLSAGQSIQKDSEGKPVNVSVVNMLVTPEQAEILSLASNETRIQLVLRNPLDKENSKTKGTAIAYLFSGTNTGLPGQDAAKAAPRPAAKKAPAPPPPPPPPPAAKPAPPPPPPPPITVEVLHGSRKTEAKFQAEDKDKKPEDKQ